MKTFSMTDEQVDKIVVSELLMLQRLTVEQRDQLDDRIDAGEILEEFERQDLADAIRQIAALDVVLGLFAPG